MLENLPIDILICIAEFLPLSDSVKLARVSKSMSRFVVKNMNVFVGFHMNGPNFKDFFHKQKDNLLGERFPVTNVNKKLANKKIKFIHLQLYRGYRAHYLGRLFAQA